MRTGTSLAWVAAHQCANNTAVDRRRYNPVMDEIIQAIDAEIKRLEEAKALLIGDSGLSGKRGPSASNSHSVLSHRKTRAKRPMEAASRTGPTKPESSAAKPSNPPNLPLRAGEKEELKDKLFKLLGNSEMSRTNLNHAFRGNERSLLKPILTELLEEGVLAVRFDSGKTGRAKAVISIPGAPTTAIVSAPAEV
jgi:hypothetical protein